MFNPFDGEPRWPPFALQARHFVQLLFSIVVFASWELFESGHISAAAARMPILLGSLGIMLVTVWGAVAYYLDERWAEKGESMAMAYDVTASARA